MHSTDYLLSVLNEFPAVEQNVYILASSSWSPSNQTLYSLKLDYGNWLKANYWYELLEDFKATVIAHVNEYSEHNPEFAKYYFLLKTDIVTSFVRDPEYTIVYKTSATSQTLIDLMEKKDENSIYKNFDAILNNIYIHLVKKSATKVEKSATQVEMLQYFEDVSFQWKEVSEYEKSIPEITKTITEKKVEGYNNQLHNNVNVKLRERIQRMKKEKEAKEATDETSSEDED